MEKGSGLQASNGGRRSGLIEVNNLNFTTVKIPAKQTIGDMLPALRIIATHYGLRLNRPEELQTARKFAEVLSELN